jgi:hypothetical protein
MAVVLSARRAFSNSKSQVMILSVVRNASRIQFVMVLLLFILSLAFGEAPVLVKTL